MKPPVLEKYLVKGREIAVAQRDADLKWVIEWGEEDCDTHEYGYNKHTGHKIVVSKHNCSKCWQKLKGE